MQIVYFQNSALPVLAWIAHVSGDFREMRVEHGSLVETQPTFFIEGAWGGAFCEGDLIGTETVFGSGAVVRGESVWFTPSLATTDYLFYAPGGNSLAVSNSLALLLADRKDSLIPDFVGYAELNNSILAGVVDYVRDIPTVRGGVRRLMHNNLTVSAAGVREVPKPAPPAFQSFEHYASYLKTSYMALVANARAADRRHPLRIYTTQSRGYDTTAINAIAAPAGVDGVFTITTGKAGGAFADDPAETEISDDGTEIAHLLGLGPVIPVARRSFRRNYEDEVYFHAGIHECQDANLREIASHVVPPALLLTGTLGEMWYRKSPWYDEHPETAGCDLRRGDLGGHGLAEVRLRVGYVQTAIPYLGARRRADIIAITESPEMQPWRLDVAYDRPIPRRLGESAGVPRTAFGQTKIGSVVELVPPQVPIGEPLKREYLSFLRRAGLLSRLGEALLPGVRALNAKLWFVSEMHWPAVHYGFRIISKFRGKAMRPRPLWRRLRGSLYCFAVNKTVREYSEHLAKRGIS